VNLAQDLSPGTAFRVDDLVPEARLSPCFLDRFLVSHVGFMQSLEPE